MRRIACGMIVFGVLAAQSPAAAAGTDGAQPERMRPQVVNGEPVDDEWPNVVYLENEVGACTGTLIAATWVLTAAHCVGPDTVIGGGSNRVSTFTWVDQPIASYIHPAYDPGSEDTTIRWDYGLYQLSAPHPFAGSEVRLAEPDAHDQPLWQPGAPVVALGWGLTEDGEAPDDLRAAQLTVQADADCQDVSGLSYDPNVSLCAWEADRSVCQGDSGGPVFGVVEDELVQVGVTSWVTEGCRLLSVSAWVPAALAWVQSVIEDRDVPTYRLFGGDRFGTAAVVSSLWDVADVVYVATGGNFPDSLAAGPAAAADGAPILLVNRDGIPESTSAELDRLAPSVIVVLGGPGAVSEAVLQQLGAWGRTIRLSGRTRYETAVAVSSAVFEDGAEWVTVATGRAFADGLIAGAAGANGYGPLLLVDGEQPLELVVRDEIQRLGASSILLVGDTDAVTPGVRAQLAELADVFEADDPDPHVRSTGPWQGLDAADVVILATSRNYPDGLSGAGLAGNLAAPMMLIPGDCVPPAVLAEVERLAPATVVLLGGRSAISRSVENLVAC